MEYVSLQQWLFTALLFAVILGYEFWHAVRKPHRPSIKSSAVWSGLYIVFALLFGLVILYIWDRTLAMEYVTGYVTERALSIDNLFVFILIMSAFAVPRHLQQLVMITGVAIAVVLRAVFILLGSAIIERFSWVFYLFGIFLLITAWKLLGSSSQDEDEEYEENAFIRTVRRVVPVSDTWESTRMFIRQHGVVMLTPLALMGMVQLYFLLGGLLERLVYLNYGLAFVLALIGVKLVCTRCTTTRYLSLTMATTSLRYQKFPLSHRWCSLSCRWWLHPSST